jgi:hypothetical protein
MRHLSAKCLSGSAEHSVTDFEPVILFANNLARHTLRLEKRKSGLDRTVTATFQGKMQALTISRKRSASDPTGYPHIEKTAWNQPVSCTGSIDAESIAEAVTREP